MVMFLIMAACMYPVLLILYAVVRSQAKPGSGLLFGARLPEWLCEEPEVEQICRRFKKKLNLCLLVLALVPLAFLPIRYVSISTLLWMLWLFAAIAVPMIPFAQANRAVRDWKAQRGALTDRDKMCLAGSVDDDDCWLGGVCYYNPGDKRVMVEKRFGVGTTMNMATAAGKATGVFLLAVLLGTLVLCAWLMRLEFTPIHLACEDGQLVARQLGEDYVVDVEDIRGLELVEELPAMTRTNGTGMNNLLKGTFRVKATGERVKLFLDPRNSVFLNFTVGDTTYYMSCAEDTQTIELYQQLSQ